MSAQVTDAKAEQVCKSIEKTFAAWFRNGPTVIRNYNHEGHTVIMWEEGPYCWPDIYCQLFAGYDAVETEFGFKFKALKRPVSKVFIEPYNHIGLAVYRD